MSTQRALTGIFIVAGLASAAMAADSPPRPNILFLMADDLGWKDVGFHGSEIKTPHLDRLAAQGVQLHQFYVQPVCTPTRSSLLTGRYPMRYGLQVGVLRPWSKDSLPLEERTLAQALKEVGYETAIVGKWHLGWYKRAFVPTRRGFDHQYGQYHGALDYFTHLRNEGLDWHRDDQPLRQEGYTTQLIAQEAVRIVEQHDPKQPLFLYVPFNAVHAPLMAPQEYIDRYSSIERRDRRIYAAMTTCMDDAIGRIVEAFDRRGMRDNTLILFSSDNGGELTVGGGNNDPLRGAKASLYEGGIRVPALAVWPGKLKAGSVVNEPLHMVDYYPTLLTLAGASLKQTLPLDGLDAWPTIAEGKPSPHREILHNVDPAGGAIRRGPWKLIVTTQKAQDGRRAELFNIAQDPNEKADVSSDHPEIVKELRARLDVYAHQAAPPKSRSVGDAPEGFQPPAVWEPVD